MSNRIYSLPEPEKTTFWKSRPNDDAGERDRVLAEAGMPAFRDVELDAAIKRTEEIKTLMSPPGTLGLPERLEAARWKWGIPDGAFKARALFDRIHVFPVDFEDDNKRTKGGLWVPEVTQQKGVQSAHRGVLLSMGLTAADKCTSHGVELGDVVRTIRNAPHAQECARLVCENKSMYYLVMRDADLTGDESQEERLRSGEMSIVDEGGEHSYCYQILGRKKRGVFVNDSW